MKRESANMSQEEMLKQMMQTIKDNLPSGMGVVGGFIDGDKIYMESAVSSNNHNDEDEYDDEEYDDYEYDYEDEEDDEDFEWENEMREKIKEYFKNVLGEEEIEYWRDSYQEQLKQDESQKDSSALQEDYEEEIDEYGPNFLIEEYMLGLLNGSGLMPLELREQVDDMLFEAIWSRIADRRDEKFLEELELVVRDCKDFLTEQLRIEEEEHEKATTPKNATQYVVNAVDEKMDEYDDNEKDPIVEFIEMLYKTLGEQ